MYRLGVGLNLESSCAGSGVGYWLERAYPSDGLLLNRKSENKDASIVPQMAGLMDNCTVVVVSSCPSDRLSAAGGLAKAST